MTSGFIRGPWPRRIVATALALACLWLVFRLHAAGQPLWALGFLAFATALFVVYAADVSLAWRYLFPGIAGMLVFVAFPLAYMVEIGFTNYSSSNLLTRENARAYLLDQAIADEDRARTFTLHADGRDFRLMLAPGAHAGAREPLVSPPLALRAPSPPDATPMRPLEAASWVPSPALALPEVLRHRDVLMRLRLELPDRRVLSYAGVREYAPLAPVWMGNADGSLTRVETGEAYRPDAATGFFTSDAGERVQPGFRTGVGFAHYVRMATDADLRGPFLAIFAWTVVLAALTVLFSLAIGMTLAVLLNWEALRLRTAYRTLLFLPYAVPAFISILVFKGLFNQNFGEINAILDALFGIRPAWTADPTLARAMLLIVNTWLGYPYVMILCTGLLKSIPADLYEASAIAGATPLANFTRITAPLIVKPLMPLLISAFAYNFNNFVLVWLLTEGRPDFLNTKLPAGTTDILVSYTYRIAFRDSNQEFGLAAAISTVIFLLVILLASANLRLSRIDSAGR